MVQVKQPDNKFFVLSGSTDVSVKYTPKNFANIWRIH